MTTTKKTVIVLHPESQVRIMLRSELERRGLLVATDHSGADLLAWASDLRPDLVLVDRSILEREGLELLSSMANRWPEAENVRLPETLDPASLASLLGHVERLLHMHSTRRLLAV